MLARFVGHRSWMTMNSWLGIMIFSVFSNCNWAYNKEDLPSIENEDFIKKCVDSHNEFRSQVAPQASNMLRMSWDRDLAKIAKEWAKKCNFEHNVDLDTPQKLHPTFATLGENIWVGGISLFTEHSAIKSWNDEVLFYNSETQQCTKPCLHYTQIVWANTYKIGCAVQFCPKIAGMSNAAFFICDYGPPGNYASVKPYQKGEPCSECKNDTCVDKLCTNSKRDEVPNKPSGEKQSKGKVPLVYILVALFIVLAIILAILVRKYYKKKNTP